MYLQFVANTTMQYDTIQRIAAKSIAVAMAAIKTTVYVAGAISMIGNVKVTLK